MKGDRAMDIPKNEDLGLELEDDQEFFGLEHDLEYAGGAADGLELGERLEVEGDLLEDLEDFAGEDDLIGVELDGGLGELTELGEEDYLGELAGPDYQVIGKDTRKRILNTRREPWRHIVKISPPGCTGTLIAPNKVLTAAHCVYSRTKKSRYAGIRVIPGKNGSLEPFGAARAIRVNYPSAYVSASTYGDAWPHDYAVITLDQPIGRKAGHWKRIAAISPAKLTKLKLNTAGYPGDKGGQQPYWTYNRVISVRGPRVEYVLDTFGGQSGSPVWFRWRNNRVIVAIHTARDDTGTPIVANRGVAITPAILRQIQAWVRS